MKLLLIHELLTKCVTQGFTLNSISKATQISVQKLNKVLAGTESLEDNFDEFTYLSVFLGQLYDFSPLEPIYFSTIIDSLEMYFGVSQKVIANYIGITQDTLVAFYENSQSDTIKDKRNIELNIMHLFTTFIRDKRYSLG